MNKLLKISLLCLLLISINNVFGANRYWIANAPGNWNDSNNWSTATSGSGGASVPTTGDFVYFTANGIGNCNVDIAASFDGLNTTGYTGILDLNGFTFNPTASGTASITFNDLQLNDGTNSTTLQYNTTGQTDFNGGAFNIPIDLVCGRIDFDGGTFNKSIVVEDNGGSSTTGAGGCTFNSTFKITNSGTSYFLMGQTSPDIFNDDVTIINTSTSRIRMAYGALGTVFNGNITIGSTNGSGIWFGETGGSSILASGKSILIDPIGFSAGDLRFEDFLQLGNTPQNLSLTGNAVLRLEDGTVFNGNVNFDSPRVYIEGTTFNGLVDIEKTGSGSDASIGGNIFVLNTVLTNSGSGYFMMGNGNPDNFQQDLTFHNQGTDNCYLAHNSVGNNVGGNFTMTNSTSGSSSSFYVNNNINSTLSIGGNCILNNIASSANTSMYLGENGNVTIAGNLIATNNPANLNGNIYIANQTNSNVTINGNTTLTNSGTQISSRIYFGSQGSIQQDGSLTIINNSTANNSQIYCNNSVNSASTYNGPIVVESTQNQTDGVYFGSGNGTATLAAGNSITVGTNGFVSGELYLRNFSSLGTTNQAITTTDTSTVTVLDCNFGGDIDFRAPRITITGTAVTGTTNIEKTNGIGNDLSYGGNKFTGDLTITNSGSSYLAMAYINPDSCMGNVACYNTGEDFMYLFYFSEDNYIGGNLIANNTGSGNNSGFQIGYTGAGSFEIAGDCHVENNATSNTSVTAIGNSGDFTIGGNLIASNKATGNNSNFYLGNNSVFSIGGTSSLTNSSTGTNASFYISNSAVSKGTFNGTVTLLNEKSQNTKQMYVGNLGDNEFNSDLHVKNSSDAGSSRLYLNNSVDAYNEFNGNIILECDQVNSDGILFGNSNGSATLAAGKTISVGPLGFIAGDLILRNFTQLGNTTQNITCTGLTNTTIYNSEWNGDISFTSPRFSTRGTLYAETSFFEKTGADNDGSVGGNSFLKTSELKNTGTGQLLMGNGDPDIWGADLTLNNLGGHNLYIAYNSVGNSIAGNLLANHATTGTNSTYTYIGSTTLSTLSIVGNCTLNMNGMSTNNYMSLAQSGTVTIGGNLKYTSTAGGNNAELRAAYYNDSKLTVVGNTIIDNQPGAATGNSYLAHGGEAYLNGDLTIIHGPTGTNGSFSISNNTGSLLIVDGNTSITTLQTGGNYKQFSFGNQGAVTCNGDLSISNQSDATSNQIYCNSNSSSVGTYNGNIILESTHVDGDGIFFGNSAGSGTLAATKTVTIGSNGFIAGNLTFRNFHQIGNTSQNITITGTSVFTNIDSEWEGAIDFRGPRMFSNGTHYHETSFIEKTGDSSDGSSGGNIFEKNCELKNSGTGYLLFSNGNPDIWNADLLMNNVGENQMYIAYNSAGNIIAGDFTVNNMSTGASSSTHINVANINGSHLRVDGLTNITNQSSSNSHTVYLGQSGSIDFMDDVLIQQNGSGNNATILIARNTNSTVNITGDLTIQNNGSDINSDVTIASNGIVNLVGELNLTNSPTGLTGDVSIASGTNSEFTVSGNAWVLSGTTGGTSRVVYVGNNGETTFNGTLHLINQSDASNSNFYCNHNSNAIGNYNENIFVECSNVAGDGISFGSSNGMGTLAAGKTINLYTGGFIAGRLYFRNFTQLSNTAQSLNLTGTAYLSNYQSNWEGAVNFIAPRMYTFGTHYHEATYLEKSGSVSDMSNGGNQFDEDTELRNTGDGYFGMSNGTADTWNKNLLLNNLGTDNMYIAYSSAGNSIGGNLLVNNNGTGNNNTVFISSASISTLNIAGDVTINNLSAANSSLVYFGASGDITTNGKSLFYNYPTSNSGQISIAANNGSELVFNDDVTATNDNGNGTTQRIYLGSAGSCIFNATVQINNNSAANSSEVYANFNNTGVNYYNENIEVNNTNSSADGVLFGAAGGYGELATGKTITIGAGGFTDGTLLFRNFNQLGATPQALTVAGAGRIENYSSIWNGNVDFRAEDHYTRETIYNGTVFLEKNGPINNASNGANTFNQSTIIQNNGTGYFMPANGTGNDYNADVLFKQTNSGPIHPCYNSVSTFAGNITVESPNTLYFGAAGNGRAILDGITPQSINSMGTTPIIQFRDLQVNNPVDEITLNTQIDIVTELDLDQGNIISDAVNLLHMTDNSFVSSVSDNSFVAGPMTKRGNEVFAFPVGKSGYYRPISISAPSSSTAEFLAEYFMVDPHPTYNQNSLDPTIEHISSCEYWTLDRTNTGNQVNVTLSWNNNTSCGVDNLSELVIARWDGLTWKDEGNGGTAGTVANGSIVSASPINNFSPFTLASTTFNNPLPVELIDFTAEKEGQFALIYWETASEINNDYFEVQRAVDGQNYYKMGTVNGAGNSSINNSYNFVDENPNIGVNYYRLKQVDYDGTFTYTEVKTLDFYPQFDTDLILYPNPTNNNSNSKLINNGSLVIQAIEIYNEVGALVSSQMVNENSQEILLEPHALATGLYTVRIIGLQQTVTKKWMVQ
ncbi:hypothetical protein DNU06_07850 [Putridiphycobacter roseus]|uniref:Secretion system C-terminal sorting domain-containing protein n=1 Tax=Putridiphycobacter roseus TaxID=2219161 RepID=A0A2W1N1Q8_9FLAO|nr:T9SS type A sorting domain-containing protein [Putridiphycobacter roseus]PZE17734.1 hypothetical protein DNU06_07850 [Putridiphycobacter roseus]